MKKPQVNKPRTFSAFSLSQRLPKLGLPKSAPPTIQNPPHPKVAPPQTKRKK